MTRISQWTSTNIRQGTENIEVYAFGPQHSATVSGRTSLLPPEESLTSTGSNQYHKTVCIEHTTVLLFQISRACSSPRVERCRWRLPRYWEDSPKWLFCECRLLAPIDFCSSELNSRRNNPFPRFHGCSNSSSSCIWHWAKRFVLSLLSRVDLDALFQSVDIKILSDAFQKLKQNFQVNLVQGKDTVGQDIYVLLAESALDVSSSLSTT